MLRRSPHAKWYTDTLPAMVPIALLGSAVYLGLQLTRSNIAHEKYLEQANARVSELEAEIDALHSAAHAPAHQKLKQTPAPSRWFWR